MHNATFRVCMEDIQNGYIAPPWQQTAKHLKQHLKVIVSHPPTGVPMSFFRGHSFCLCVNFKDYIPHNPLPELIMASFSTPVYCYLTCSASGYASLNGRGHFVCLGCTHHQLMSLLQSPL